MKTRLTFLMLAIAGLLNSGLLQAEDGAPCTSVTDNLDKPAEAATGPVTAPTSGTTSTTGQ